MVVLIVNILCLVIMTPLFCISVAMKPVQLAVLAACLCAVSAGWLPERLVKKYAMKKVRAFPFNNYGWEISQLAPKMIAN